MVLAQNKQTNKQKKKKQNRKLRIESPEINPWLYGQLIFNKAGNIMQWNEYYEKIVSSSNGIGKTG